MDQIAAQASAANDLVAEPAAAMGSEPASKPKDIWFVIPVYNEESVIAGVVSEIVARGYSVVCVDDGSKDDSVRQARLGGAAVVRHPVNLGQGSALQTGIEYALRRGAKWVVTFDADGQHQLADAQEMIELAHKQGLSVVFGSRFLDERTDPGAFKTAVLRFAAWFTGHSTGLKLTDAHNGLRVLKADAAEQIDLKHNGMAHASEIVRQVARTKLPWAEYPVHILYTDYSKGKGQSMWNTVNILVDLIVR